MTGADRVRLRVDGRDVDADPTMTVAAALLNAGVLGVRTSVGGERRGPLCAMGICHECRVTIDGLPHRRACLVRCRDGMRVDTGREEIELPRSDPDAVTITTELAIIGGGPAGIGAAARASEMGLDVILLDESPALGGQIWRHRDPRELPVTRRRWADARAWMDRIERSDARVRHGASVVDIARDATSDRAATFLVTAETEDGVLLVHADAIVLATGARERFAPFPGWTLPGVMGVGAAQALMKSGLDVTGKRVVVGGTGPLILPVASMLARRGADVRFVAEQVSRGTLRRFALSLLPEPWKLAQAAKYLATMNTRLVSDAWVSAAHGSDRVETVSIAVRGREHREPVDYVFVAYGLVPNVELAIYLGCALEHGRVDVDPDRRTSVEGIYCAGEPTGVAGVDASLVEGQLAGLAAATDAGRSLPANVVSEVSALRRLAARGHRFADRLERTFAPRDEVLALAGADDVACRCEDVPLGMLDPGWTTRQAKLYSRAGMGPCQGRVCGPLLCDRFGWARDSVRSPSSPASLSTLVSHRRSDRTSSLERT